MKKLAALWTILLNSMVAAAQAVSPVSAALTWTAPTKNTDGTAITGAITYNVYQGLAGALVKVGTGLTTAQDTITTGLTPGTTQCFAVTAVVAGIESGQSATACAAIPQPTPGVPTQVIVVITGS
jgi:hypothetical protein